jgi:hypothetical protein
VPCVNANQDPEERNQGLFMGEAPHPIEYIDHFGRVDLIEAATL